MTLMGSVLLVPVTSYPTISLKGSISGGHGQSNIQSLLLEFNLQY